MAQEEAPTVQGETSTIQAYNAPESVEEVRYWYRDNLPIQGIPRGVAEFTKAFLEKEGYVSVAKAIDVAIHNEIRYPSVSVVMQHHDNFRDLIARGAVVGPCYLRPDKNDPTREVFVAKGVGFWIKPSTTAA